MSFSPPGDVRPSLCLYYPHLQYNKKDFNEPTGALDYNTSKEILKLIETVNHKYGNTIVMVTHNDAIKDMADRVVKLRDGMIRRNYQNEQKIPAADLEW